MAGLASHEGIKMPREAGLKPGAYKIRSGGAGILFYARRRQLGIPAVVLEMRT
jgi:hypothetical protein